MISPRDCRVFVPALGALTVLALTGCDPEQVSSGGGGASSSANGGGRSATGFGASPLDNPDGTKPGLAPLTSDADRAAARKVIEKVATKGRGPKTGYERDKFGYAWKDSVDGIPLSRNGCDTRIISMLRAVMSLFSQRMQGVVGYA